VRTLNTFQGTHILGASRGLLCDSSAVLSSFNKHKKILFKFLTAGFCPKNLAFAQKIMALSDSEGLQPPWLARLWTDRRTDGRNTEWLNALVHHYGEVFVTSVIRRPHQDIILLLLLFSHHRVYSFGQSVSMLPFFFTSRSISIELDSSDEIDPVR